MIPIEGQDFLTRLEAMETWLVKWGISYEVAGIEDAAIVIRFPTEAFAGAFAEAFALEQRTTNK